MFETILGKCKEAGNGLVLNHVISSFHPDYIAANATTIAGLIKDSDDTFPKVSSGVACLLAINSCFSISSIAALDCVYLWENSLRKKTN